MYRLLKYVYRPSVFVVLVNWSSVDIKSTTSHVQSMPMEQFLLLGKAAKGAAAAELIKNATEHPGLYVFGELLELPEINALSNGPHENFYRLLELFAYGTYEDWRAAQDQYPPLSDAQIRKLKQLTVTSMASGQRYIKCSDLQNKLDIPNLRELEDLIIEMVYANLIRGKLDQRQQLLEIDSVTGRDLKPDEVSVLHERLTRWCATCEDTISRITAEISSANNRRLHHETKRQRLEEELTSLRKAIRAQASAAQQAAGPGGVGAKSEVEGDAAVRPVLKESKKAMKLPRLFK